MATANMYALSLRGDGGRPPDKPHEDGVPFFVPQLAKVKTTVMCQTNNKHLLFSYEKSLGDIASSSGGIGPTSPIHLPYRKQGDQSYYTDENLKKRRQLMEDRKVLAGIARFWDTFPNVRQGASVIDARDYVDVFMKFYKALVAPQEFSIGEARKIVERDWGRDVGDSDAMGKALFFRALFEVADIWTTGISADEYVSFLNKLFNRVTMKIQDQKTSLWVTIFAELDKIRSFAEPRESIQTVATAALASKAAAGALTATNQDSESALVVSKASSRSTRNSSGPPTGSDPTSPGASAKPRPPLLKKKTLSSDAMTLSNGGEGPAIPAGISFRRLPELSAMTNADPATSGDAQTNKSTTKGETQQSQQNFWLGDSVDSSNDNGSSSSGAGSSRGDGGSLRSSSPKLTLLTGDNNSSIDAITTSAVASPGPITYRQSRFTRTGSFKNDLNSPSKRSATGESGKEASGSNASRPTAADLPPQPVRLAMPSIYLSPDLTESPQATYRAARRRIRESSKLAQRLRRITF